MSLKTMFVMTVAAVGGIYLTSEEGKKARDALRKKKSLFEPMVKKLLKQTNDVLEGTQKLDSEEVKATIQKLLNEARKALLAVNLDKTTDTAKEAIRVASKKIREAANEQINAEYQIKQKKSNIKTKTS